MLTVRQIGFISEKLKNDIRDFQMTLDGNDEIIEKLRETSKTNEGEVQKVTKEVLLAGDEKQAILQTLVQLEEASGKFTDKYLQKQVNHVTDVQ